MNPRGRIGLFGGNFDPVHCGHLDVADAATRALGLQHLLLMPSHVAPHRRTEPRASTYHRFAMVALASLDRPGLLASDFELRQSGPSYTSVTLGRLIASGYDPGQLFFIAGADAFAEIATWHDYPALLDRGHFVIVSRPSFPAADLRVRLPDLNHRMREAHANATRSPDAQALMRIPSIWLVEAHTMNISSTDIRALVGGDRPITGLVPPLVETYIRRQGLYRPDTAADELHE